MTRKSLLLLLGSIFLVSVLAVFSGMAVYAAEKPIQLRFSSFMGPASINHQNYTIWAKEIEEKTKGRVKITIYPSQALGKAKDHYEMAAQGIVDIAWFALGFTPGRFPLSSVLELPMKISSSYPISMTAWDIFEKYLQSEFKDVKILALYANDPYCVYTTRKPVRQLEDMKGLKIRAGVPNHVQITKAWGAAPIQLPTSDVYDGLNRGLIDGALLPYAAIKSLKVHEVTKYLTQVKLFSFPNGWGINRKVFDRLPSDIKKIIEETSGRRLSERAGRMMDSDNEKSLQAARQGGLELIPLSPAERDRWLRATDPIIEKNLKDLENAGLPARKVYEEAKMILKKY